MGYVFNGPIKIHFERDTALPIGRFTVASEAVAGVEVPAQPPQPPRQPSSYPAGFSPPPAEQAGYPPAQAQLVLEVNGMRHPLAPPGITIGRGTDADLRINDPGISRLHAEIRVSGSGPAQQVDIVDLGSTNGIVINGEKVRHGVLTDGTRIQIGSTRMLVHAPSGR